MSITHNGTHLDEYSSRRMIEKSKDNDFEN